MIVSCAATSFSLAHPLSEIRFVSSVTKVTCKEFAALTYTLGEAALLRRWSSNPVTFSFDWLLLVTFPKTDRAVGGMPRETTH